jgi:hypothetical protein
VARLQEENARLRSLLIAHGIPISEVPASKSERINVSSTPSEGLISGVATAEQRIARFRSLFRGREDIYAIRWESNDGRSGYMPKADRDWKSYLNAKEQDRKKIDRQTRTYRPLTGDVVRAHLVGDLTVGIYPLLLDESCWLLAADFDKKTGMKIQPHFSLSAVNSTYQPYWNARDLERAAMYGSSLNSRSQPPQPANSAA